MDRSVFEFMVGLFLACEAAYIGLLQPRFGDILKELLAKSEKSLTSENLIPLVKKTLAHAKWCEYVFKLVNQWIVRIVNIATLIIIPTAILHLYVSSCGKSDFSPLSQADQIKYAGWGLWYLYVKGVYYIAQLICLVYYIQKVNETIYEPPVNPSGAIPSSIKIAPGK